MLCKTCNFLAEGIEFRYDAIALCNHIGRGIGGDIVVDWFDDSSPETFSFDVERYINKRNEVIIANQSENVYPNCRNCKDINALGYRNINDLKISHIVLHYWTKCNSNCIYCYTNKDKNYFNKRKHYNFLPILKTMIEKNIIDYGGIVNWAGGEISCLEEFEKVLELFDSFDYFSIFNSSAIVFEQSIANHILQKKGMLIVSLDSGTQKTHRLIKQVDSYEQVCINIKRYFSYCDDKSFICLKYIILPDINDNEEEIISFLNLVKKLDCKFVIIDIDLNYFAENRYNIPEKIVKLFIFAFEKAKQMELSILLYNNAFILLQQKLSLNKSLTKYMFDYAINEYIDKYNRIYSIDKKCRIRRYNSIKQASIVNKIDYMKIKDSCSKEKYSWIKNNIYVYADKVEINGQLDNNKISEIYKNINDTTNIFKFG